MTVKHVKFSDWSFCYKGHYWDNWKLNGVWGFDAAMCHYLFLFDSYGEKSLLTEIAHSFWGHGLLHHLPTLKWSLWKKVICTCNFHNFKII